MKQMKVLTTTSLIRLYIYTSIYLLYSKYLTFHSSEFLLLFFFSGV